MKQPSIVILLSFIPDEELFETERERVPSLSACTQRYTVARDIGIPNKNIRHYRPAVRLFIVPPAIPYETKLPYLY